MNDRAIVLDLVFVTEAALHGADIQQVELRVPSIRGALRWWFRVLGGTPEQEDKVFGSVHQKPPIASAIRVRAEKQGTAVGLPAGTAFTVRIEAIRQIDEALWERLKATIEAFCRLGTLGRGATQGNGMVATRHPPDERTFREWVRSLPDSIRCFIGAPCDSVGEAVDTLRVARQKVLDSLPTNKANEAKQALGSATPRQTSALRRCPVRLADGKVLPVLLWIPQTLAKRFQSVLKVEQLRDCLRRERFLQVP